jgi:hypothetical protein
MMTANDKPGTAERGFTGYSDACMAWIMEQLEDAKKNDQFVIAMTIIPWIPRPVLFNYRQRRYAAQS